MWPFNKKTVKVYRPEYDPKEDITAYELAKITPMFTKRWGYSSFESYSYQMEYYGKLPDNIKRHFKIVEVEIEE